MEVPGFQANLRQSVYTCKLLFITCYPQETQMSPNTETALLRPHPALLESSPKVEGTNGDRFLTLEEAMSLKHFVIAALFCCGSAYPILAENCLPGERDSVREELAELKQQVVRLLARIDALEKQTAQAGDEVAFRHVGATLSEEIADDSPMESKLRLARWRRPMSEEVIVRGGVEEGMMVDALEHAARWGRRYRIDR